MKKTLIGNLTVFMQADLPNMASHCHQDECGFSIYKGVLVQWDEDRDERVLSFIDSLPDFIRFQLLVVQEHEAVLGFVWRDRTPKGYEVGDDFDIDGDIWNVGSSVGS